MNVFSADFLFRNALAGGLLVCVLCAVLGIYVVLRRLSLLGVALPQAGAAGVALAFWASQHGHAGGAETHGVALAGSVAFTFAALLAVLWVGARSRLPTDSRIAAVFAVSSALTVLLVALDPGGDFEVTSLLRGELLAISDFDLGLLALVATLTGALFLLFRREILLASVDPDFSRSLGRDPWRSDALLYGLLGLAIGVGVMTVGPLVVFGFLTLPALGALRVAGSLGAAFAIAAAIGAASSLGGFALAYHADLPAGPVDVALAAALWLVLSLAGPLRRRRHRVGSAGAAIAVLVVTAVAAGGATGCAANGPANAERAASAPASAPGGLPAPDPARPIAVLRIRNETGETLRVPGGNPLRELGRAAGDPFAPRGVTVPDLLEIGAAEALAARGFAVLPLEEVRSLVPAAPADRASAVAAAKRAGLPGLVLAGVLERWTPTQSHLVLVRLELELLDPEDGRVLWSGSARRPAPVPAALTVAEIVRDAAPHVFAEAFGAR
jgi:ABC-type Mn2+/Zn2+ transport system permease subunit